MGIIEAKKLVYEYIRRDKDGEIDGITRAVDEVDLDIERGDFIAILGHNGSGKSTLAKHMNAILYPTEGTIFVDGKDTSDLDNMWDIRQTTGMVFQNPDNQIIGTVVEEDVGFGFEEDPPPPPPPPELIPEVLKLEPPLLGVGGGISVNATVLPPESVVPTIS